MDRRDLLQTAAAFSLAAMAGTTAAAGKPEGHAMMDHHHDGSRYGTLAHAATHCVMLGEACLGHCLELLGKGDTSMADCSKSVVQMMAVCNALRQLATWNSAHVPSLAKVAQNLCTECEQACRKHEKEHAVCRDCAEACAECARECASVAA